MSSYPREPRAYELMAILLPELSEEDTAAAIDRVTGYITDGHGEIKEILQGSPWGRRRLAYTIRFNGTDYRDGYYVIWHFDLVPSGMPEIERELKLDTRVIRYLIVHDDPKWGSVQEREAAAAAAHAAATAPEAPEEGAASSAAAEDAVVETETESPVDASTADEPPVAVVAEEVAAADAAVETEAEAPAVDEPADEAAAQEVAIEEPVSDESGTDEAPADTAGAEEVDKQTQE